MSRILDEKRPITACWLVENDDYWYRIGQPKRDPVVSITTYGEVGEMAEVPWVCIESKSGTVVRISTKYLALEYGGK